MQFTKRTALAQRLTVAVLLALGLVGSPAFASIVTVTSHSLTVVAGDGGDGDIDFDHDTQLNRTSTTSADEGSSHSATTLHWSADAANTYALFDFSFDQQRGGREDASQKLPFAETYDYLTFTVSQDTSYRLSGAFGEQGKSWILSQATLIDKANTQQPLFEDVSESQVSSNEHFVLGVANDGDRSNSTAGSLSGNLTAGHTYQLFFHEYIYDLYYPDPGATAAGSLRLEIGNVPAVPEPAMLTIWSLGALSCAVAACHRRGCQVFCT